MVRVTSTDLRAGKELFVLAAALQKILITKFCFIRADQPTHMFTGTSECGSF